MLSDLNYKKCKLENISISWYEIIYQSTSGNIGIYFNV